MMLDGWDEDESLSNGRDGTEEGLERQLDIIVDVERECHVEKALEGGVNHTHGCSVQVCGCVSGAVIVGTGSILRALGGGGVRLYAKCTMWVYKVSSCGII